MNINKDNIIQIAKGQFRRIFKDGGTILIMCIAVFLYGIFYMFPFSNHIVQDVPIAVVDQDNSSMSRQLIRNLNSNQLIKVADRPTTLVEAKESYYRNKINGSIIIPKDFEQDVKRGKSVKVTAYEDSTYLIVYKQIAAGIIQTVGDFSNKIEIATLMKLGLSKDMAIHVKSPFELVDMPLYNPIGSYQNYIVPLICLLILQQTMLIGSGMLGATIKEQINGVKIWANGQIVNYKADKVNEISDNPIEIVLGKAFAYVSLYFIYALMFMYLFPTLLVYKMTFNPSMFLILIPFLFCVAFLGQALVGLYTNRENSLMILIITSVPMIFEPGFVWPKESLPFLIKFIGFFVPTTPTSVGLVGINQMGASFCMVQSSFWHLLFLTVLYFGCACKVVTNMQKSIK